ncbi:MAG TPA: Uma2 family endonuclease [Pseudonocardiaceae bacterium]|jgi:Uma2 family endonuclease
MLFTMIGAHTLDDWDRLEPVEGLRVELVAGLFRVSAGPAVPRHQRIADEVGRLLAPVVEPLGWDVLTAIGVRVLPGVGYTPDVVICEPADDDAESVTASTVVLVVEVESPSTRKIDRFEKPTAYAAAGVAAYWRVEVVKHRPPVMFCYELDNGVYTEVAVVETGKPCDVKLPVGGSIVVDVDRLAALPHR